MILHGKLIRVLAFIVALLPGICLAQAPEFEDWNAKYQATYVWQGKRPFSAAYSGANSLSIDREKSYSFTATAAFGFRPWTGGELYFNPEAAQGIPLSAWPMVAHRSSDSLCGSSYTVNASWRRRCRAGP